MNPARRFALIAAFLCGTSVAQPPTLPAPETVDLDRLGYMQGFPPPEDRIVNNSNRTRFPQSRWAMQHVRELLPTRNIRRSNGRPSVLYSAPLDLDKVVFRSETGQDTTLAQWQRDTYTDALIVLHRGRVVYERYHNQMQPHTPHLVFSITKSFTGLLAAQLVHEGIIDDQALVTRYVPELADSAWADMTVRHVLDMTGAVRFREVYTDPSTEIFPYLYASTMVPAPTGYAGPRTIYDFLRTLKKQGEHGEGFVYRTVHSEVLGWIVSRATGKHFADLMSERFWMPLGMEEDAYVMIDPVGTPLQGAGLNATARDLARFGEMLRRSGEFNGRRVLARAVIEDLRRGGDREKFKASGMSFRPGYSYRNQWWIVHDEDGSFEASGVHGQMLHINPTAEMVVVKLSSHPVAANAFTHGNTMRAFRALAQALKTP
jgi:CubicO group peptidase (beta-lactamase class C family)